MSSIHKNILLTGGRAFATLDLVRQFASFGHHIIIAESVPIHLCRYSKHVKKCYLVPQPNSEPEAYIDALIDIIQAEKIDLIIPTCEEVFFIAKGLDHLREYCAVFAAPLAQMRRLHNKWDFNQLVLHAGLPVPNTHLLTSQRDLQLFIEHNQRPFVLKPVFSRFATNVLMVDVAEQASRSFQHLTISEQSPWIAQERIYGKAMCSYSIAHKGKLVAHAVYAENFTAGRGACIQFVPVEHPEIEHWVAHFITLTQFSGQIAFDFMITDAGDILPLECNPRATSGVHLFQKDDQLPRAFLEGYNPDQQVIKPKASTQTMIAIAMLVYGLRAIRSWTRLKEWLYLFSQAKDVIFDAQDMKPFLSQLFILWYNWKESRKLALSLQAFSTIDIEWNGQD